MKDIAKERLTSVLWMLLGCILYIGYLWIAQ